MTMIGGSAVRVVPRISFSSAVVVSNMLLLLLMLLLNNNNGITVDAAPLDDLIVELPRYGRPPTPHFSGYLDGSKGCDVEKNGPICKIHYWLALADEPNEHNPLIIIDDNQDKQEERAVKPTVLWLNGGPGSSSLLGYVQEVGPLLINATGGLMENPYSWTKAGVNLMAIEAPMGVGFSYCSSQIDGKKACENSDTSTAKVSRAALVDFFSNKFPELADGPFYIAGESYAGVYIPTLSKELLTDPIAKDVVPLKGIMVGDPCTDNAAQRDSMDPIWYSNKYGLMDSEIYDVLMSDDCDVDGKGGFVPNKREIMMKRLFTKNNKNATTTTLMMTSKTHRAVGKKWSHHVAALELNQELIKIDDLTERRAKAKELYRERVLGHTTITATKPVIDDADVQSNYLKNDNTIRRRRLAAAADDYKSASNKKCTLALRKFLLSSSDALSQGWDDLYIDDYSLFAPVTSKEDEQMANFFNKPEVRKALHVEDTPIDSWPSPSKVGFHYEKEYNACNWQPNIKFPHTTMVDIYQEIVPKLDRTWIYNGDTDPCVSYEGTREAVKQILFEELDGGSLRPFFFTIKRRRRLKF